MRDRMCYEHEFKKSFWIKRAIFAPIAIVAILFIVGNVVMLLWNNVLTPVLNLHTISFWQAVGILVLCKILFGNFHHRRHGHHHMFHRHHELREKWANASPEEREKMRSELRNNWRERFEHKPTQD